MGVGAVLVFFGVALFSAQLIRPIAAVLGVPGDRLGRRPGVLARENATRNPQRTGSNAGALMIGITLVTLVTMLAVVDPRLVLRGRGQDLDRRLRGDGREQLRPDPGRDRQPAAQDPRRTATWWASAGARRAPSAASTRSPAIDPGASHIFQMDWKEGSQQTFDTLGNDGAFTDKSFAEDHNLKLGSRFQVLTPGGDRTEFTIKGIFDPPAGGSPFAAITIASKVYDKLYTPPQDQFVFFNTDGGVSKANDAKLDQALAGFPNAKVQDRDEFKDNQASFLKNILNILYVLLALSVIVSLFGIVNTLVLTIFERTRELGMLRAVGMTRWQVRTMIALESVVTALIGAVIGIGLGIVLAVLLIVRVDFLVLSWPVTSLLVFALVAIVAGIVAAIFPAQRAARLNVLEALQYE